jgi:hypothetical protein
VLEKFFCLSLSSSACRFLLLVAMGIAACPLQRYVPAKCIALSIAFRRNTLTAEATSATNLAGMPIHCATRLKIGAMRRRVALRQFHLDQLILLCQI